jgi:hypothetical protein
MPCVPRRLPRFSAGQQADHSSSSGDGSHALDACLLAVPARQPVLIYLP